jgi:hypothetical protein
MQKEYYIWKQTVSFIISLAREYQNKINKLGL